MRWCVWQVSLTTKLEELVDQLAMNTHNIWACERIQQGWTYGLNEDPDMRRSPHLVSYLNVDDAIKKANRDTASETIRTLLVYGYLLEAPTGEQAEGITRPCHGLFQQLDVISCIILCILVLLLFIFINFGLMVQVRQQLKQTTSTARVTARTAWKNPTPSLPANGTLRWRCSRQAPCVSAGWRSPASPGKSWEVTTSPGHLMVTV